MALHTGAASYPSVERLLSPGSRRQLACLFRIGVWLPGSRRQLTCLFGVFLIEL